MTTTLIRRAGVLALIAATTTLTGCAGVLGAKMTYNDTEPAKVSDIVLSGAGGDVTVTTAAVTQTTVTRVVRRSSNPGESYHRTGTTLAVDTSCGPDCSVSYQIQAPIGVTVRGRLGSGDVHLDGVAATDLEVTSGDLTVTDATGPVKLRTSSGDVRVANAKGTVQVRTTSGDIEAVEDDGPLDLHASSGDITARTAAVRSVTASTTSGDIALTVPAGAYKIVTSVGSGDTDVHGMTSDNAAKNVIDLRAGSGDVNLGTA
jgi:hypothetical protein